MDGFSITLPAAGPGPAIDADTARDIVVDAMAIFGKVGKVIAVIPLDNGDFEVITDINLIDPPAPPPPVFVWPSDRTDLVGDAAIIDRVGIDFS